MKISVGSDHAGFVLKTNIIAHLEKNKIIIIDNGCFSEVSVDYPDIAHLVCKDVESKKVQYGILICGSGQGMSITANKHKNIRAALCWSKKITLLARQHNNANVITLPARFLVTEEAISIIDIFLSTGFEGGRHQRRIDKVSC